MTLVGGTAQQLIVCIIKLWSYSTRSDWLCSRFASGYVNTINVSLDSILLVLFYKININQPLLVYTTWYKTRESLGEFESTCSLRLSNSPKCSLMFASGYVNTHVIFYFCRFSLISLSQVRLWLYWLWLQTFGTWEKGLPYFVIFDIPNFSVLTTCTC